MRCGIVILGVAAALAVVAGTAARGNASVCNAQCAALADLADLRATVQQQVPDQGIANSLIAKVDAATSSVEASRQTPALNQLGAFDNQVAAEAQSDPGFWEVLSDILKLKSDTAKAQIQNIKA
jgi:hypothetical protein